MVAIIVEGGKVREVLSEVPGEALVIDLDTDGSDESRLSPADLPDGERVIANLEGFNVTVNPLFIAALKSQLTSAKP